MQAFRRNITLVSRRILINLKIFDHHVGERASRREKRHIGGANAIRYSENRRRPRAADGQITAQIKGRTVRIHTTSSRWKDDLTSRRYRRVTVAHLVQSVRDRGGIGRVIVAGNRDRATA